MKERGHHYPEDRAKAVQLFAQAASVPRMDSVLSQNLLPEKVGPAKQRYEEMTDMALYQASICSPDVLSARGYLEQIISRNQTPGMVQEAKKRLEFLKRTGGL